jgi:orotidine-5'-phosphate decarboxylase
MIPAEKIIVALDTANEKELERLFIELRDFPVWVKIGMELFYALGTKPVLMAREHGLKVFLDLKLHDIPNTAAQGIKSLCALPVQMLNVHSAGGLEMMKRCMEVMPDSSQRPYLIAVTQLTSTTEIQMNSEQGIPGKIADAVLRYANLAKLAGLNGVVCSPHEVSLIKSQLGKDFITVTPGIRPIGSSSHDQARITTPREAFEMGTDFMVIGRPITGALSAREALTKIIQNT